MDLTPKLLTEGTDFQQVRRGYDPDEVDDFLERVAAAVSRLQGQLVEANRRAEAAESAARAGGQSGGQPAPENTLVEEMQRTLVLAQRTADAAVREAREEADSLVSAARREAATVLTNGRQEADRYAAESRLQLATEVRELEDRRDALYADLDVLEKHVDVGAGPPAHRGRGAPADRRAIPTPSGSTAPRAWRSRPRRPAQAAAEPMPMPMPHARASARTGVPARAPGAAGAAPGTAVSCRS